MIRQSDAYVRQETREREKRLRRLKTGDAIGELENLLRLNRFFTRKSPPKPLPVGYSRLLRRSPSP